MTLCSSDLDLDLLTLIHEVVLDIVKIYLHTKNEVSRSRLSKVRARTGQTDRRDRTQYHAVFTGWYVVSLLSSDRPELTRTKSRWNSTASFHGYASACCDLVTLTFDLLT